MVVLRDETGAGGSLAADVGARLEQIGAYRREARPWLAHVTVLRFRRPPQLVPAAPELGTFVPSDAAVYISLLQPGGVRYEVLESVRLQENGAR